jgi:predicted regulator of Ras-like GTPase activity (Roadblock/LC7/MglB family)
LQFSHDEPFEEYKGFCGGQYIVQFVAFAIENRCNAKRVSKCGNHALPLWKHKLISTGGKSLSYILDQEQLDGIEEVLQKDMMDLGLKCVILIDMAGNIIANLDNGQVGHDVYSLAALAAGNFGAVCAMAAIIGEDDFALLFHKGKSENIHFSKVMDDFLLVTIFGNDVSLGYLRLKVDEAIIKISTIFEKTKKI